MADISKIKLPDGTTYNIKALNATDTKVTQTSSDTADSGNYPILFANTADNITRTEGTRKSNFFTVNPANRTLDLFNEDTNDDIVLNCATGSIDITGKVSCSGMNVKDISEEYIPSKTSGNWSIGSDDGVYRIKAHRMGNLVQMSITFHGNGSAVSSGSNGFVGDISGGPLPVQQITLTGFYSSSILAATLDTDGSITVRPFSASCTLSNASRAYLTGTFICADDVVDEAEEHQ